MIAPPTAPAILPVSETVFDYTVFDALGMRVGQVVDSIGEETTQPLLQVRMHGWPETTDYLIPIGALNRIDDAHRRIYLRLITKSVLQERGLQVKSKPTTAEVEAWCRPFPRPQQAILRQLKGEPNVLLPPTGPEPAPRPAWTQISAHMAPVWKPLARLFDA